MRFTETSLTPGRRVTAFSTFATQEAQSMPSTRQDTDCPWLPFRVPSI